MSWFVRQKLLPIGCFLAAIGLSLLFLPTWAVLASLCFLLSLPLWLPHVVVALRFWIFTKVNGDEGTQYPNPTVQGKLFKWLYNHPAAKLRSRQSGPGLSDTFWYFLAPAHYIHQEHVESETPTYTSICSATRKILAKYSRPQLMEMAREETRILFSGETLKEPTIVSLRDFFFPMFANLFHRMVFDEPCPPDVLRMIVSSASNVILALKCTELRDMELRDRLTKHLMARIEEGKCEGIFDERLTLKEQALHLQGVFFHTGCVQLAEEMAHVCLCVAQEPGVQERLQDEVSREHTEEVRNLPMSFVDCVISEQLRLYPLFGVAHRITDDDITLPDRSVIPSGSVLLFNYQAFQTTGFKQPKDFLPNRWLTCNAKEENYIPFGVPRNRPCPGQALSQIWVKEIVCEMVKHAQFHSSIEHNRSLPCGGLCVVAPLKIPVEGLTRMSLMAQIVLKEAVESVGRSLTQLVLGTYMLWDARKQQLAFSFYQANDASIVE